MNRLVSLLKVPSKHQTEARAIYFAGAVFVISLLVSFIIFWPDRVPLFGGLSVGLIATIMATAGSLVAFYFGNVGQYSYEKNMSLFRKARLVVTKAALALTHAAVCFLLAAGLFYLFYQAFIGLTLDAVASSLLVAAVTSMACYVIYLTAYHITTLTVSAVLAVFLTAGVLTSMITAVDPYWWQVHFSSLGGTSSLSSHAFNITLIVAGIVTVALSDFVANDFARLKQKNGYSKDKVNIVRGSLALIGLFLAGVGAFEYNVFPIIHLVTAAGMAVVFIALLIFMPRLVPSFSRAFITLSFTLLGTMVFAVWLLLGVGYLNLTAFELISAAIIFGWLVVFIRQIATELDSAGVSAKHSKLHSK